MLGFVLLKCSFKIAGYSCFIKKKKEKLIFLYSLIFQ